MILPGKVSVFGFIAPLPCVLLTFLYSGSCDEFTLSLNNGNNHLWLCVPLYVFLLLVLHRILLKEFAYQVAMRALFLGCIFSVGLIISIVSEGPLKYFGWYTCLLSFFHWSEFVLIAYVNPSTLNIDSFMLDHSKDYKLAVLASWIEFFVELYFLPGMKEVIGVSYVGLAVCALGEMMRKGAMLTARRSFTHVVQWVKPQGHTLVTSGPYALCRHPSYVGWFYWCLATQLVLLNPVCFICYSLATWKFFSERIRDEEISLLNFYGVEYVEYQKKVPTGLPFIKGYLLE